MNEQEAVDFVIKELGKHRQPNEIIQTLCEKAGFNWVQAENFVRRVISENRGEIVRKRSWLISVIGIFTFIGGLLLCYITVLETLNGTIIILLRLPIPYLGNVVFFLTGIAMIIGSFRGLKETIITVWNS